MIRIKITKLPRQDNDILPYQLVMFGKGSCHPAVASCAQLIATETELVTDYEIKLFIPKNGRPAHGWLTPGRHVRCGPHGSCQRPGFEGQDHWPCHRQSAAGA